MEIMKGKVFYPDTIEEYEGKIVFLAGPIQGAPDWQSKMINRLQEVYPSLNIASPKRIDKSKEFVYNKQVDWETHYLNEAAKNGVIIFYLANEAKKIEGRAYAQTTRFELGEWKAKSELLGTKLVIGIEEDFTNARYIRRRIKQDCMNAYITDSLEECCQISKELLTP